MLHALTTAGLAAMTSAMNRRIKELMTDAGLSVREDAVGNTFGRWEGSQKGAGERFFVIGSDLLIHVSVWMMQSV